MYSWSLHLFILILIITASIPFIVNSVTFHETIGDSKYFVVNLLKHVHVVM